MSTASPLAEPRGDAGTIAETIEEIRFYLGHFMVDQARTTFSKLEKLTQSAALLANIRSEIAAAEAETAAQQKAEETEAAIEQVDTLIETAPVAEEPDTQEIAAPEFATDLTPPAAREEDKLQEMVSDIEASLGDRFLPQTVAEEMPAIAHAETPVAPDSETVQAESSVAAAGEGVLGEFVSDLEASLGDGFLAEAPAAEYAEAEPVGATTPGSAVPATKTEPEPAIAHAAAAAASSGASVPMTHGAPSAAVPPAEVVPVPAAKAAATVASTPVSPQIGTVSSIPTHDPEPAAPAKFSAAGVDLAEMFGELKQDLEEDTASTDDDPETHYNLGVAFREMGLLDEAIGELQKVCQAVDHGHSFPNVMQTYTWLAQCFLDKGVPEAAIRWYEKALTLDTLDQETRTALHYELASSYEAAGDRTASLKFFMEVYGTNIDYRDVAERIKALKS